MSVRKSNNELFKMILRMAFIGTLVVANVLFTMVTHRHLWSQKDVLDKRIASSIVEKTVTAKRGTIYDRNHTVIAQQSKAYTIVAYLDSGVVDANGVVGIVYKTSPHYSLVIPLLNSKSSISCKIVGSDYFGYLKWEGGNSRFAYLKDLPRHAEFNLGDTVVTSGYSTVFPEGVMVGTVDDMSDSHDGLSYLLKIKLATDFGKVSNVRVISRNGQDEQKALESRADEK